MKWLNLPLWHSTTVDCFVKYNTLSSSSSCFFHLIIMRFSKQPPLEFRSVNKMASHHVSTRECSAQYHHLFYHNYDQCTYHNNWWQHLGEISFDRFLLQVSVPKVFSVYLVSFWSFGVLWELFIRLFCPQHLLRNCALNWFPFRTIRLIQVKTPVSTYHATNGTFIA